MGDFLNGVSGFATKGGAWLGENLASGVEFFGDISEGLAGIGKNIYEAGRDVYGETGEQAAKTAAGLVEPGLGGLFAQVPIYIWIAGGVVLGIALGFIPNPLK